MQFDNDSLFKIIHELTANITENKGIVLTANTQLIKDVGLDSLQIVDLVFELETKLEKKLDLSRQAISKTGWNERSFYDITISELIALCLLAEE